MNRPTPTFAVIEVTVKLSYVVRHEALPEDQRQLEQRIALGLDCQHVYGLTASKPVVSSRRRALHV